MTDLNRHGLCLLAFVEDSVTEALQDPAAMLEPLSEADCALRVLKRRLLRGDEDQRHKHAKLMLVADYDFVQIARDNPSDPTEKLKDALAHVMHAKPLFE